MTTETEVTLNTLGEVPAHITQATEEATKSLKEKIIDNSAEIQRQADEDDPKTKEEYTFQFKYSNGRGKTWRGEFTNRIISMQDRQIIASLQAQWQGAMPHAAIDPDLATFNFILAHLAVSLKLGKGTDWAKDLRALHDPDLIQALYEEVSLHEATFHGRIKAAKGGKKES